MSLLHAVEVPRLPVSRLEPVIGSLRYADLTEAAGRVRQMLAGRTIWNVNSTAAGGGVAEMLQVLVGYVQDVDIPIGWLVITGDAEFFAITKRLHNQIHGRLSGAPLGAAEAGHYAQMMAANAVELAARIRPGDVVLLHDPQTAGLAAPLAHAGARVVWRATAIRLKRRRLNRKFGIIASILYCIPVIFFIKDHRYADTWLLYLGSAIFLMCIFVFGIIYGGKMNDRPSKVYNGFIVTTLGLFFRVFLSCC